jgi:hypothetical protein
MKRELLFKEFTRKRVKKSDPTYQKYFMKYYPNNRTVKLGLNNNKTGIKGLLNKKEIRTIRTVKKKRGKK